MMRRPSFAKRRKACNTTEVLSPFGDIIAPISVHAMRTACVIGLIPVSLVLAPLSYAQHGGGHMGGGFSGRGTFSSGHSSVRVRMGVVRQKYAGRAYYLQGVANSCVLGPYS